MANPAFNPTKIREFQAQSKGAAFQDGQTYEAVYEVTNYQKFTIGGAVMKTAALLIATILAGAFSFVLLQPSRPLVLGVSLVAFVLSIVIIAKPNLASTVGFAYAICEGVALGTLSRVYETQFNGIIPQAATAVFVATLVMLGLYASRIVKVTSKFRSIVIGATLAVLGFYFVSILASLFGFPIMLSGPIAIAVSAVVCVIACFNLMLDFDNIEKAEKAGLSASYEWYAGFGVLVTLVWMYLEFLRLLSYLRD